MTKEQQINIESEKSMTMKTCSKCKEELPLSDFYKMSLSKDGFQSRCKACSQAHVREYRKSEAGKAAYNAAQRRYRQTEKGKAFLYRYKASGALKAAQQRFLEKQLKGCYKITCSVTGEYYLGSTKTFKQRTHVHKSKLKSGAHHNPNLQAIYDAHGPESLSYELLFECEACDLYKNEQALIDAHIDNPLCCNIVRVRKV